MPSGTAFVGTSLFYRTAAALQRAIRHAMFGVRVAAVHCAGGREAFGIAAVAGWEAGWDAGWDLTIVDLEGCQ